MPLPPFVRETFNVQYRTPLVGGIAQVVVTPQQLQGTELTAFTLYIGGEIARPMMLQVTAPYTSGASFEVDLAYKLGEVYRSGALNLAGVTTGETVQTQLAIADNRRELHQLTTGMEFGTDGNVQISIDLQPLEGGSSEFALRTGIGGATHTVPAFESFSSTMYPWSSGSSIQLGYSEAGAEPGSRRAMYGEATFSDVQASQVYNGTLVATASS